MATAEHTKLTVWHHFLLSQDLVDSMGVHGMFGTPLSVPLEAVATNTPGRACARARAHTHTHITVGGGGCGWAHMCAHVSKVTN